MKASSVITLKEVSVKNNIDFLKKKMGNKVMISAVLKANAYGHGIEQMAPLLEKYGITHFSVFYFSEALRVYKSLKGKHPIMIMGWIADNDLNEAIIKGFEFFVFNIDRLEKAIKCAHNLKIKAKIHLELETGMNRSGFINEELKTVISLIQENNDVLEIIGFCTHLAGAESISNHYRIQKQIKNFHRISTQFYAHNIFPTYKHVANSAAAFVYPNTRMDLVRIGIMMYGFWSSTETFIHFLNNKKNKIDPLKRILGWHTQIMAIKKIKTGEFVSYGLSFLAQTDILTALMPIGYASGYNRSLSNKGQVLIHGQRCNIIGLVNMNMIMADITNIPEAQIGDEVVIIGKQGDLEIKVSAFSDFSNKLNYEVLTHLPTKIERLIIN